MTTPMGDLPDWQTLVSPATLAAAIHFQGGGLVGQILQSSAPFRVWGVWVATVFSSNGSYAAALANIATQIQDSLGNTILEAACNLRVANQISSSHLAIAVPGFTPALNAGFYQMQLATGASPVNTDYHGSGGIFYSMP